MHVPFTFSPDPVGGTEIYVETLARGLRAHQIESVIVAPSSDSNDQAYEYNSLRVRRFQSTRGSGTLLKQLYGDGDPEAAAAFARIIDEERPNAVHIHAFTRSVSVMLVRAAKQRGIPVFFTYHTPSVSCQRGTLMLWGKEMCDGLLGERRCTSCCLESRGLPRWSTDILHWVPIRVTQTLENANLSGGLWTVLRMPRLVRNQHEAFHALVEEVDAIIALSKWSQTVLVRNGVPRSKITLLQHWLPHDWETSGTFLDVAKIPLRVAFLGRADRVKGADTLIKAVRSLPGLKVEIHLYGVTQSENDEQYWSRLNSSAARDPRIKFLPPVSNDRVIPLLKGYHIVAMPARWIENRPLVLLESFAAGTPVIGSNLGGIAELICHNEDGLLVAPDDVTAWAAALRRCAEDRSLLARLREGVRVPRKGADLASEMARLYLRYPLPAGRITG